MPSSSSDSARDVLLERLAAEFVERHRRGEHPPLSEYTDRHPDLAADIRELFPALVQIEHLKPAAELTNSFMPRAGSAGGAVPERLGEYRILREVGHGGMGVVYEAEQETLGRHVALKVLPSSALLNPTYLERFRREAKAAARLHHTNIVPVFGVGEADGVHFYAMQFIEGEGLDKVLADVRRLREQPAEAAPPEPGSEGSIARSLLTGQFAPPPADGPTDPVERVTPAPTSGLSVSGPEGEYWRGVARIGVQVAEALAYAHRQGVLHRDVKPSNLLLDAQGIVWVTDFGLAKAEGTDELTHTGDIVGTIRFMAPERFDGKSLPQSDVYGLGVTLYELLTLRPAFADPNKGKLIDKVLHEVPVPPRQLDGRIPRDLETVVLKCLAKEPGERYPSAEAVAEDLQRFLADRPIRARRSSAAERAWRWCRRNPAVATLAATVFVVLAVAAVGGLWLSHSRGQALTMAMEKEREAKEKERETNQRLCELYRDQAKALLLSRRIGQRLHSLHTVAKAAGLAHELGLAEDLFLELRNEAIAALVLPDLEVVKEWDGLLPGSNNWTFDAGLQRYARAEKGGAVSIRRVEDDAELLRLPGLGPLNDYIGLEFSPDGCFLHRCYRRDGQWRGTLCRIDGPQPVVVLDAAYYGFAFSPDSRQLAAAYPGIALCFYDVASGRELRRFPFKDVGGLLRWNPRAPQVAMYSGNSYRFVHIETGQVLAEWAVPGGPDWMDWHPAGRVLAVSTRDLKIYLWDSITRQPVLPPLEGHKNGGVVLRFHPAGDLLASNDHDGILRLWDVNTGRQVLTHHDEVGWPQFRTPEGNLLAGGNPWRVKLRIREVHSSREFRTLVCRELRGEWPYQTSSISPDGRLLAVGVNGGFGLWDLSRSQQLAFVRSPVNHVLFEPSGALLTNGEFGLLRWPLRDDAAAPGRVRVGPPQKLALPGSYCQFGRSADGRVLANARQWQGAAVLHTDRPQRPIRLGPHEDVRNIAVSPDGRWIATGSHGPSPVVKVWDAPSGHRVLDLPARGGAHVAFSPDGRWLATGGHGVRVWEVGSWQEQAHCPCRPNVGLAFSPDSRLLAFETGYGVIRLVDPATGREYAHLEDPNQDRTGWISFSPDGSQLVATGGGPIHVWDLRAIRRQLAELGLDWNLPSYPPAKEAEAPKPLQVEVVGADGLVRDPERQREAHRLNGRAWRLVAGPEKERDPVQALGLIQRAVALSPDDATLLNTLGVVLYRNGRLEKARATLERSLAAGRGEADAFDLFFLAICHARLGEPARARDCFDRAVQWLEGQKNLPAQQVEELATFRAEAERLLKPGQP
jgi:serine/threonine protein kinase/WD40 repeat protein